MMSCFERNIRWVDFLTNINEDIQQMNQSSKTTIMKVKIKKNSNEQKSVVHFRLSSRGCQYTGTLGFPPYLRHRVSTAMVCYKGLHPDLNREVYTTAVFLPASPTHVSQQTKRIDNSEYFQTWSLSYYYQQKPPTIYDYLSRNNIYYMGKWVFSLENSSMHVPKMVHWIDVSAPLNNSVADKENIQLLSTIKS